MKEVLPLLSSTDSEVVESLASTSASIDVFTFVRRQCPWFLPFPIDFCKFLFNGVYVAMALSVT